MNVPPPKQRLGSLKGATDSLSQSSLLQLTPIRGSLKALAPITQAKPEIGDNTAPSLTSKRIELSPTRTQKAAAKLEDQDDPLKEFRKKYPNSPIKLQTPAEIAEEE